MKKHEMSFTEEDFNNIKIALGLANIVALYGGRVATRGKNFRTIEDRIEIHMEYANPKPNLK